MRNALICAGTMLAMLLLWPILFGGAAASTASAAAATSTVTMAVPAPVPVRRHAQAPATRAAQRPIAPAPLAALPSVSPAVESCRATLVRAQRLCVPGNTACAASAMDAFDICEARGMWPA